MCQLFGTEPSICQLLSTFFLPEASRTSLLWRLCVVPSQFLMVHTLLQDNGPAGHKEERVLKTSTICTLQMQSSQKHWAELWQQILMFATKKEEAQGIQWHQFPWSVSCLSSCSCFHFLTESCFGVWEMGVECRFESFQELVEDLVIHPTAVEQCLSIAAVEKVEERGTEHF